VTYANRVKPIYVSLLTESIGRLQGKSQAVNVSIAKCLSAAYSESHIRNKERRIISSPEYWSGVDISNIIRYLAVSPATMKR